MMWTFKVHIMCVSMKGAGRKWVEQFWYTNVIGAIVFEIQSVRKSIIFLISEKRLIKN